MKTNLLKSYLNHTHSLLLLLAFLMMMPLAAEAQTRTVYRRVQTVTAGKHYLIVSSGSQGNAYALGHEGINIARDAVAINANDNIVGAVYINVADVDATSVWTAGTGYTFENQGNYLENYSGTLYADESTNWTWDGNNNRLYSRYNNRNYYIRYANNTFSITQQQNSVYLFEELNIYTISISANPTAGGNVTGGGQYLENSSCTVRATANTGYAFMNWTENGTVVSTNANYTFTVTDNRTLVANFDNLSCPAPTGLTSSNITNHTADLSWNTTGADSYTIQYAPKIVYDFDNADMGDWTTIDADGDGYDWVLGSACGGVYLVEGGSLAGEGHNGSEDLVTSGSFSNIAGALTPDNYLVSPQITLGGRISFWAMAQDADYPQEHFGVAVSTTGNSNPSDFTIVQEWTLTAKNGAKAQGSWHQYTVDLSAYSGQGYVAIRHFNCTDKFMLNVDDITIIEGWTTVTGITSTSYPLTGLNASTTYYVQVQGDCGGGVYSNWASHEFSTLISYTITAVAGDNITSVSVTDGTYTQNPLEVAANTSVTLTATVAENCAFAGWYNTITGALVSTSNPYTFTPTKNISLTAKASPYYTITVDPNISSGTVTTSPASSAFEGETVNVTVTPAAGYELGSLTVNSSCEIEEIAFYDGFEDGMGNWTIIRNGEGTDYTDWRQVNAQNVFNDNPLPNHGGNYVALSRSWSSTAYNVDNWLISPQMKLGGTLSWWDFGSSYPESYTIWVSTTGNAVGDFVQVSDPGDPVYNQWTEKTADLSAYEGMDGYFAFRHVDYDQDFFFIDDVTLTQRHTTFDIFYTQSFTMPACDVVVDAIFNLMPDCETETFDNVQNATVYNTAGPMPAGWFSYTTATGNNIVAPHVLSSNSSYNFYHSGNQSLGMEAGTNANNTAYVVLPLYNNVEKLSFYARQESSNGTLVLGYVDDQSATACNNFTLILTVPVNQTITQYTYDFTSDYNLPAGKYLAFSWVSTGSYYAAGLDDIEVCVTDVSHLWTTQVDAVGDAPGWNASNNPIQIETKQQLAWFISYVNGYNGAGTHPSANAILTADIDMSDYIWVPIGNSTTPYTGTFDGNYHTVTGIHIASSSEVHSLEAKHSAMTNTGIFGSTNGATIKNLLYGSGKLTCEQTNGNIGGFVGNATGSTTIEMCESAAALTAASNLTAMGGIVGQASNGTNVNGTMAVGNLNHGENNVTSLGGIVGTGGTVKTYITNHGITGTGTVTNKNAIANSATVSNGYVRTENTGYNVSSNAGYAPADYTPVNKYLYGTYNTNNTVSGTPMVDLLNATNAPATGFKWVLPKKTGINDGYPVIVRNNNTDPMACKANTENSKLVQHGNVNTLTAAAGEEVYLYSNGDLSRVPAFNLFIDEDVAVTQSASGNITATVGITMDNSANNGEMNRDWHCFSTPLTNAPLGITYTSTTQLAQNASDAHVYAIMEFNDLGYFPSNMQEYKEDVDFYSFYEPEYHWINFKRNSNSHWHEDNPTQQITYTNESTLTAGKGYLIAIGDDAAANKKVYLSANGTLNNASVPVTLTCSGDHLTGYNFLGNPYQSYLDFNLFASTNASHIWSGSSDTAYMAYLIYDADKGGFDEYLVDKNKLGFSQGSIQTASRYIHPHQGFFVLMKKAEGVDGAVTFTNAMRSTTETSDFRDESQPAYPLVNLICTDDEGKQEKSVIEFERPSMAGSLRMKGMLGAKGNMYIRWDGEDFGNVFLTGTPDYVPVWFKAEEQGVFTMTWSTANGDFSTLRLIDNLTGANIDMLTTDSYSFEAKPSDSKARFRLVFSALGIEEEETTSETENFAFINGNELVVTGEGELSMIDLNGRVLVTECLSGQQSHITLPNVAMGMYMLRLTNNKDVKVQKIVVRK